MGHTGVQNEMGDSWGGDELTEPLRERLEPQHSLDLADSFFCNTAQCWKKQQTKYLIGVKLYSFKLMLNAEAELLGPNYS